MLTQEIDFRSSKGIRLCIYTTLREVEWDNWTDQSVWNNFFSDCQESKKAAMFSGNESGPIGI